MFDESLENIYKNSSDFISNYAINLQKEFAFDFLQHLLAGHSKINLFFLFNHATIKVMENPKASSDPVIDRHKTAISRYNFSKPVQSILEHNLLEETESFFDFGCGLGDDLRGLSALGYSCSGWDPVHKENEKKLKSDVVMVVRFLQ